MGANLIPSAQRVNASTAGQTSAEPSVPTAAPVSFTEILSGIGTEYGGLSHLFGGSTQPVDTNLSVATDSTVGRFGGLVPAIRSVVAPGPTTTPDSAGHLVPNATPVADAAAVAGEVPVAGAAALSAVGTAVSSVAGSVRRFLGI